MTKRTTFTQQFRWDLSMKVFSYLNKCDCNTCSVYGLPEIHKSIDINQDCIQSDFPVVDLLQPILCLIRSDIEFLYHQRNRTCKDSLLISFNTIDLYISIIHEYELEAIGWCLWKFSMASHSESRIIHPTRCKIHSSGQICNFDDEALIQTSRHGDRDQGWTYNCQSRSGIPEIPNIRSHKTKIWRQSPKIPVQKLETLPWWLFHLLDKLEQA